MRIYCQYSTLKTLLPRKGDVVTEVGIYSALSQFAEVYYGGTRFCPEKSGYGLHAYAEPIEVRMKQRSYDVYYVRGNQVVFDQVPEGKPKLWVCSPYNRHCFQSATTIGAISRAWEKALRAGTRIPVLNPEGLSFSNVTTIYQTVRDTFKPLQGETKTKRIRREVGGRFIIGCFGRVTESNYPHALLAVLPWLAKEYRKTRLLVGVTRGEFPQGLPNTVYRFFEPEDMPRATSACDLIYIPGKGFTWPIRGSLRALEAGACGVPVLLCQSPARAEHLGEDYPLFLPEFHPTKVTSADVSVLKQRLKYVIQNERLRERLARKLPIRTNFFSVKESGRRLKRVFEKLEKQSG